MSEGPPAATRLRRLSRYGRALAAPLVIWVLVVLALRAPLSNWLRGEDSYDQDALKEGLDEARGASGTLRDMVDSYVQRVGGLAEAERRADGQRTLDLLLALRAALVKREEIKTYLGSLGNPPTKTLAGQLP